MKSISISEFVFDQRLDEAQGDFFSAVVLVLDEQRDMLSKQFDNVSSDMRKTLENWGGGGILLFVTTKLRGSLDCDMKNTLRLIFLSIRE